VPATYPYPEPTPSSPHDSLQLPEENINNPKFNVHGFVHRDNIIVHNSNKMHKSQCLFHLTTALHVSGVTITYLQEHQTTVTTASGNRYTVLLSAAIMEGMEPV
jgi:hypothetical protein